MGWMRKEWRSEEEGRKERAEECREGRHAVEISNWRIQIGGCSVCVDFCMLRVCVPCTEGVWSELTFSPCLPISAEDDA